MQLLQGSRKLLIKGGSFLQHRQPHCHPGNNIKIESFCFIFKSFCYNIFTNFPKKNGDGGLGNRKEPKGERHSLTLY